MANELQARGLSDWKKKLGRDFETGPTGIGEEPMPHRQDWGRWHPIKATRSLVRPDPETNLGPQVQEAKLHLQLEPTLKTTLLIHFKNNPIKHTHTHTPKESKVEEGLFQGS